MAWTVCGSNRKHGEDSLHPIAAAFFRRGFSIFWRATLVDAAHDIRAVRVVLGRTGGQGPLRFEHSGFIQTDRPTRWISSTVSLGTISVWTNKALRLRLTIRAIAVTPIDTWFSGVGTSSSGISTTQADSRIKLA